MKQLVFSLLLMPSWAFAGPSVTAPWTINADLSPCEQNIEDYKLLTNKLKEKIDLQSKEINILDQRLSNYMTLADSATKELGNKETTEGLYRFGYFVLGAVITGYIAVNVRH